VFFAIIPMHHLSRGAGIREAVKQLGRHSCPRPRWSRWSIAFTIVLEGTADGHALVEGGGDEQRAG
jgi:hypothetical protein